MKTIATNLLLLLALTLAGCSSRDNTIETKSLSGSEIFIPEDFTGALLELDYKDTLVFTTYDPQAIFETAILRNDSLIQTEYICHKGGGPFEFTDAAIFNCADSSLMIFCHASGIASLREIDNLNTTSTWKVTNIDSIVSHLAWTRRNIVQMNNGNILFVGTSKDNAANIFSIIDPKRGNYTPLDYWPEDGFDGREYTKQPLPKFGVI